VEIDEHDEQPASIRATVARPSSTVKPPEYTYSIGATVSWRYIIQVDEVTFGAVAGYASPLQVQLLNVTTTDMRTYSSQKQFLSLLA
jgi:hypothetical protein